MQAEFHPLHALLLTVSGLERAHQGVGNERIEPGTRGHGEVVCDERLGGLLKCYRRVA